MSQVTWYGLYRLIRNYVNREDEVHVITAPIFNIGGAERLQALLRTDKSHQVPDKFFRVVVNNLGQSAALILSQSAAVHVHLCEMIVSIEDTEDLTGLDLFSVSTLQLDDSVYSALGC